MKKLLLSIITLLTLGIGAWAQETQSVNYIDTNYQQQTVTATVITNSASILDAGWYVVLGNDVQTNTLTCQGAVNLIVADGAKLTAHGVENCAGIQVSGGGNSLTIYGQTAQTGQLIATGSEGTGGINDRGGAGIGGDYDSPSSSKITINGGVVTANGGTQASGIGGGKGGSASNIKVVTTHTVRADGNNPPTTVIDNNGGDLAESLAGKRYAVVVDLAPIKADAIEEIDLAIEGVTDENILAIANTAKTNIGNATTEEAINSIKTLALAKINALYQILIARQGIQNAEINSMINDAVNIISNATDTERITDAMLDAMTVIGLFQNGKAEGIEQGRADALGPLGTEQPGPAVKVTKGDTEVILYLPDKVEYIIRK